MWSALCCQHPMHQSRACRCVQTRSRPWMRAHLPELRKAHGQVVNKWKWKIATTCGSCSSTCKRERRSGHDGCPVSPLLLIWSKNTRANPSHRPSPPLPPFTTIIDKQMCAGRPASAENCPCAKLPSGWEILFICCMSPIMVLSPSRLGVFFIKIAGILTCFFSVKQVNRHTNSALQHVSCCLREYASI